jgi:hypothetical protein
MSEDPIIQQAKIATLQNSARPQIEIAELKKNHKKLESALLMFCDEVSKMKETFEKRIAALEKKKLNPKTKSRRRHN